MSNERKIVIAIVIVVVLVLAAAAVAGWWSTRQSAGTAPPGVAGNASASSSAGGVATDTSPTRGLVPSDVTVPNKGQTSTPAGVAVPVVQGAGDVSGNVSYRSFNISAANGAYSPATISVYQGDTVNLEITAVDGNYGFDQPDYGFNAAIPKGKTQTIQFQALQTGNFLFYCDSCGGPAKGPVGHIIVAPKP